MKDDRLDPRYRTEPQLREQFSTLTEAEQCEFFVNLCAAVGAKDRDAPFMFEIAQHLNAAQRKECRKQNDDSYDGDKNVKPGTVGALLYGAQRRIASAMDTAFNWHHIQPIIVEWGLVDLGFTYRLNRTSYYLLSRVNKSEGVTHEIMIQLSRAKVKKVVKVEISRYTATTPLEAVAYSKGETYMRLAEMGMDEALPVAREYKIDSLS